MMVKNNLLRASTILALFIGLSFVAIAREPIIPMDTATGVYQISTQADLEELQACVGWAGAIIPPYWTSKGKTFMLMDDLILFDISIGSYSNSEPFMGTFDGNGHKIILFSDYTSDNLGLFGYTQGATIKNLTIAGEFNFYNQNTNSGVECVGGVVGRGDSTTITNCVNLANITVHGGSGSRIGGIAGLLGNNSTIKFCSNVGNITAPGTADNGISIGGIVGNLHSNDTLSNCMNVGTIEGRWCVGGIAGSFAGGVVNNCMNAGWIKGTWDAAGIVGVSLFGFNYMQRCLNVGVIEATSGAFPLIVGMSSPLFPRNKISDCYYDKQMSPYTNTPNPSGVYGLNTDELTRPEIREALGDAWTMYPKATYFSHLPVILPNQVYSYPVLRNGNNVDETISYIAAVPARLTDGECWNSVSKLINLDFGYFYYNSFLGILLEWPNTGSSLPPSPLLPPVQLPGLQWQSDKLTILAVVASFKGYYCGEAQNPTGYGSTSELTVSRTMQDGHTYKKTVPVFTIAPFKININNYETYGFEASEILPNIVTNNAVIDISSKVEGNLNVAIFDISGSKVMNVTDRHVNAQSQNQVELTNLSNLANGSYMVAVSVGNNVIFRKFIKQ